MLSDFISYFKLQIIRCKWRKKNKHNGTYINTHCELSKIKVAKGTYGHLNIYNDSNPNCGLEIGNYCSIAHGVAFVLSGGHNYLTVSTYPFSSKLGLSATEELSKGKIIIEDDVWIGHGAVILSGVKIGRGGVVASGAVVSNDVPPYAIVGGVPAKIIKYRFSDEIINKLLKIDYSNLSTEFIKNNIEKFYEDITADTDIEWIIKEEIVK
ncbi:MAG: CatB-related O-acetyltransferase [Lachnospiraceae bacterium]|nr:CatB-related O-acetyltransferase [Lachnospiraceae bacterium]